MSPSWQVSVYPFAWFMVPFPLSEAHTISHVQANLNRVSEWSFMGCCIKYVSKAEIQFSTSVGWRARGCWLGRGWKISVLTISGHLCSCVTSWGQLNLGKLLWHVSPSWWSLVSVAGTVCLDQVNLLLPGHKQQMRFDRGRQHCSSMSQSQGMGCPGGVVNGDPLCPTDMRGDVEQLKAFEETELREKVITQCYPPIISQRCFISWENQSVTTPCLDKPL